MKRMLTEGNRNYYTYDAGNYYGDEDLRSMHKKLPLRVLSDDDFAFWQRNGYVVIKEAVPRAQALETFEAMLNFANMDLDKPEDWYRIPDFPTPLHEEMFTSGMVECYHHELLWKNRQSQRVYDAFVDVWDSEELWVALDRVNINPPNNEKRDLKSFIHWDIDTKLSPIPQRVQGVLILNDPTDDMGGFQCSPTLFQEFDEWVKEQPEDRHSFRPELSEHHEIVKPKVEAGDLVIFNGLLPHGIARNESSNSPRSVQYLSMMPAVKDSGDIIEDRLRSYITLSTPGWDPSLLGDGKWPEGERYSSPLLTSHGQKLLGAKPW